ncbi:DUF3631 domain-containing protein [Cupriavidus basilensis]|uniref:DUF3631 domain-containing protein n=1 Tax=Cupriavidus basilensis TaxID=68895 RepID=A0ABT6B0X7_9BURK|nr:DUF3631 domain-containing protein [Cupriavidus basilensis]MDF3838552.1 DUF3631 domain-containing protein [Cupriavidus basilensis]
MNTHDLFPLNPVEWPRSKDAVSAKVAGVFEKLARATAVHPVASAKGLTRAVGFECTAPLMVGDVDCSNALALPIWDKTGKSCNVLVAYRTDGGHAELTIPGAQIEGGYIHFGTRPSDDLPTYVATDWASAAAIHEATEAPVACAIYTDNLHEIAADLQARYPGNEMIICAGTTNGPSRRIATETAAHLGIKLAVAEDGGSFIGCYKALGSEGILRSLKAATVPDSFVFGSQVSDPLDPPTPTRWPGQHVNGSVMAQHAVMLIMRHLIVDAYVAIAIVLWALATYFVDVIRVAPLLAFFSPVKRCGKTTALGLLKSLVNRAYAASNLTPATLFRMPAHNKPTLLIDEADTFFGSRELTGIINSGHTRQAASITRVERGRNVSFSTFFMKAIFGIGHLPETLEDRSILIELQRKRPEEIVEMHMPSANDAFAPVRACFARLAHEHANDVRNATRDPINLGNDRFSDNWEPLLAVASILGSDWLEHARHAATKLSARTDHRDQAGLEELLSDIKLAFESAAASKLSTGQLMQTLTNDPEKPWGRFTRGGPITAHDLARLLRPLHIRSVNLRTERSPGDVGPAPSLKGYYHRDFEDAFARYLPSDPSECVEAD